MGAVAAAAAWCPRAREYRSAEDRPLRYWPKRNRNVDVVMSKYENGRILRGFAQRSVIQHRQTGAACQVRQGRVIITRPLLQVEEFDLAHAARAASIYPTGIPASPHRTSLN